MRPDDLVTAGSIESTIRQAEAAGMIVDGDLATSKAAAIAAVQAKVDAARPDIMPIGFAVVKALNVVEDITGVNTLLAGGSVSDIYDAIPGTWSPGFSYAN